MEKLKTVNSLSGGKTSSFLAVKYPADYNVFSLVRTNDKNCLYPDPKIRQIVSDKIGQEFIGTLEEDVIIKTIIELEQFIGSKIDWVSGKTFDEIINRNGKIYLPNVTQRFCTVEMKLEPIKFEWFAKQERDTGYGARTFKNGMTYDKIKEHKMQSDLFDSDFNECDSGYCGI